ncbi:MAG: dTDP-4-dehydrorhamnose 3,5-epimerase [Simkaniaceae bacterium]
MISSMHIASMAIEDIKLLKPRVFSDERGFFMESFRNCFLQEFGISEPFVQDNHSYSKKGVIRGMHFQTFPGQNKLVRVVKGKIFDVAVDIRPDSRTFKQWVGVYLDDVNHEQLFIPAGFAHGFCVVSEEAHVLYKVSSYFDPETEKGFRYNDPEINIAWPVSNPIVSERDRTAPTFKEMVS